LYFNLTAGNYALDIPSLTLSFPPPAAGMGGEMDRRGNFWVEIKIA